MFLLKKYHFIAGVLGITLAAAASADVVKSKIYTTEGVFVGEVIFEDITSGLLITPRLHKLPPGIHGFHIHQNPDCGEHGMKAGGHFDPNNTHTHQGPYGNGHLGDLPVLVVDSSGVANIPVLAPRLHTKHIQGHAVMIHSGGDNYSDNPALGGGGGRIACGRIPS